MRVRRYLNLDTRREWSGDASIPLPPTKEHPEPTKNEAERAPTMTPAVGLFNFCGELVTKMKILLSFSWRNSP
jgi:hypothetical protein